MSDEPAAPAANTAISRDETIHKQRLANILPHRYQPGVSKPPPPHLPAWQTLAKEARKHGAKAVQVLAEALDHRDAKVRIVAARELLDRGFGKAPLVQADEPVKQTIDLSRLSDEQLRALRDMAETLANAGARAAPVESVLAEDDGTPTIDNPPQPSNT